MKYLSLILLPLFSSAYGQYSEVDSLITKSKDKSLAPEARLDIVEQAIDLADKNGDESKQILVRLRLGKVFQENSMYAESVDTLVNSLSFYNMESDSFLLGHYYNVIGVSYGEMFQNGIASNYFLKALNVYRNVGNRIGERQALNNLGLIHYYHHEYEEARSYFEELIREFDSDTNQSLVSTYLNLGHTMVENGDYLKALEMYATGSSRIKNLDYNNKVLFAVGVASTYRKLGQYRKAYSILFDSVKINDLVSPKLRHIVFQKEIAKTLIHLDSLSQADERLTYAYRFSEQMEIPTFKMEILGLLADVAKNKGEESKAIEFLEKKVRINDSVQRSKASRTMRLQRSLIELEEERSRMEIEKRDEELLHRQQALDASNQLNTILLISMFSIFGLGVIVVIVLRSRARVKVEKELSELELKKQVETSEHLQADVQTKNDQLTELAIMLSQETDFLRGIKTSLDKAELGSNPEIIEVRARIAKMLETNGRTEGFYASVQEVNAQFIRDLEGRFNELSQNEVRLICLLKLNLSNKEISNLIDSSAKAVEMVKYRLKKKFGLSKEDDIISFVDSKL